MTPPCVVTVTGTLLVWSCCCVWGALSCGAMEATPLTALQEKVQSFTSTNYPRPYPYNTEECWKVKAASGYRVMLETTNFMVEVQESTSCSEADYVDVRDGYSQTSPLLRRLCSVQHVNITSTGNHMFIRFRSDQSISSQGFLMKYWAVRAESATIPPDNSRDGCKETSRLTAFDVIKSELVSPNYPESYYPSLDKCWQLESIDSDKVILLEVIESAMEQAYSCQSGDYVEARDGKDPSDPLLDRWCGDNYPVNVLSTGPYLLLRFHTDLTDSHFRGFRIRYSIVTPPVNTDAPRDFDTPTSILIGTGVLLVLLSVLMAAVAYHKKSLQSRGRGGGSRARRRASVAPRHQEEDLVRMAFAAILRRPGHHRDIRVSPALPQNLQAPPPYEAPRPPSHVGFMAPAQPGYHPWTVQSGRHDRRRRRRTWSAGTDGSSGGSSLPYDPPPYEEIIKDIEQREWILGPVLGGDPQRVRTVSEAVTYEDVPGPIGAATVTVYDDGPSPRGGATVTLFEVLPAPDAPPPAGGQTMPPGYISGDSPQFLHPVSRVPETGGPERDGVGGGGLQSPRSEVLDKAGLTGSPRP